MNRGAGDATRCILLCILCPCLVFSPAWAAECRPTVVLDGQAAVVSDVSRMLRQRGIATFADESDCPAVRAQVTRRGSKLDVIILLQEVRRCERLVEDPSTAATLIESWARSDISQPLLFGHGVEQGQGRGQGTSPVVTVSRFPDFQVFARPEVSIGTTGVAWLGASLGACIRAGRACLGMRLRLGGDVTPAKNGDLAALRFFTDLLATVDVPLGVGRVTFSPGVGAGIGWLRTAVVTDDGNAGTVGDGGLRLDVHGVASLALFRGLALDLSLSLSGVFLGSGDVNLYLPDRKTDPMEMPGTEPHLPQVPWGFLRAGVGLRWTTF